MRKKQKKKIILWIILSILCAGLVLGLILKPESLGSQIGLSADNQTNGRHPREDGDPGIKPQDSSVGVYPRVDGDGNDVLRGSGNDIAGGISEPQKFIATSSVSFLKSATFKVGGEEFIIQVTEHTTVYDAMNSLTSEGKMTFDGKKYSGLGFFVTQINSLQSGGGKNLMYYINGEEASQGVSTYIVKEGDNIEWKLK
jgi:hypothetical protein